MADRDINVRLKFQAEAQQASQSLKSLATEADRLQKARQQAGQHLQGGFAPTAAPAAQPRPGFSMVNYAQDPRTGQWAPSNAPSAAAGKTPAGGPGANPFGLPPGLSQLAGSAGVLLAAVKGTEAAMKATAQGIEVLGNSALTNSQKLIGLAKAVPVLGGIVEAGEAIFDAITGVNETIRKMQREAALQDVRLGGQKERAAIALPVQQAFQLGTYKQQASSNNPAVQFAAPSIDQLYGPGGDLALQQAEQRAQVQLQKRQANIESAAAQALAEDARKRTTTFDDPIIAQQRKRRQAEEEYSGFIAQENANPLKVLKDEKLQALKKGSESAKEEIALQEQKTAALQNYQALATQALEKEKSARQANIDVSKAELEVLKSKEALLKGQATSFGSLDAVQRQAALEAAKRISKEGYDRATPEERALITQAGGGNFIAAEAQKSSQNDPRFREFLSALGQKDTDLKSIIESKVKLQGEIIANVQIDENSIVEKLTEKLRGIYKDIDVTINQKVDALKSKAITDQNIGNTMGK